MDLRADAAHAVGNVCRDRDLLAKVFRDIIIDKAQPITLRIAASEAATADTSVARSLKTVFLNVLRDTAPEPGRWPHLRFAVVDALRTIELEKGAIPVLEDVASNANEDPETRRRAFQIIAGFETHAEALAPRIAECLLEDHQSDKVTNEIVATLSRILPSDRVLKELQQLPARANSADARERVRGIITAMERLK